ncbi:MAG TPA: NAD(P)/FAD-dependent oxidoreductase [Bryobacteraceae bacterium]|nr:NAD(P)/FAD-dependent oxidoreductase [Bryobacteraceae bacterium]
MHKSLDLVVIGTGAAAATVAGDCRAAGWSVAVIDSLPFGGTCMLRGCDPKKVLVGAADLFDWMRRMRGKGIVAPEAHIDWPELMRFKRTFTGPVPQAREDSFARAGIAAFHGRARFTGPRTVAVGGDTLEGRHIVIASGARPAPLGIPGEALITYSDQFLESDRLPRTILFVGGGYIAFEFAHLAARAGVRTAILHRGARPLERFDPDLVARLVEHTRSLGIDVELQTPVEAIEGEGGELRVRSGVRTFEAQMAVHAAGRIPDLNDLDLAAAGVEWDKHGVKVNEYLRSVSNPAVYAAGDAAAGGGAPLTPVAGYHGRIVSANLLQGDHRTPDYAGMASTVFTIPPLATVGLQEEAARRAGLKFSVHHGDSGNWYSSRRVNEPCAGYKVLLEEGTGRILGAHLLGDQAAEHINLFALAVRFGLRSSDLKDILFAYPTHASDTQYMLG